MITKNLIIEAYVHLRKTNISIPDETLDFMKNSALKELERESVPVEPIIDAENKNGFCVKCGEKCDYC